jgi:hypothetical protein
LKVPAKHFDSQYIGVKAIQVDLDGQECPEMQIIANVPLADV